MWILNFLPDWFFYAVLVTGIAGLLATYFLKLIPIPALYVYRTAIRFVAVSMIIIGTFMIGAQWNNDQWMEKVTELETELKVANERSSLVTVQTVTEYKDRTKIIREKGEEIIKIVDREVVKFNDECKIPADVINIHNKAAAGESK